MPKRMWIAIVVFFVGIAMMGGGADSAIASARVARNAANGTPGLIVMVIGIIMLLVAFYLLLFPARSQKIKVPSGAVGEHEDSRLEG